MDKSNRKQLFANFSKTQIMNIFFHAMETFSKDFLEVHGLRSRGFQLLLHELQQRCARNFEKQCKVFEMRIQIRVAKTTKCKMLPCPWSIYVTESDSQNLFVNYLYALELSALSAWK